MAKELTKKEIEAKLTKMGVTFKKGILLPQLKGLLTRSLNKAIGIKPSGDKPVDTVDSKSQTRRKAATKKEEGPVVPVGFVYGGITIERISATKHSLDAYHCVGVDCHGNRVGIHVPKVLIDKK